MDKTEEILKIFTDALLQIKEEEKNYTFFNKDSFQKKFKNLLAFSCCIGSITEKYSNISVKEIDHPYLYEKYEKYITNKNITDEEKHKVVLFASTLKNLRKPDSLISHWNEIFGKDSFYKISTEPNYRAGLHPILKERLKKPLMLLILNMNFLNMLNI